MKTRLNLTQIVRAQRAWLVALSALAIFASAGVAEARSWDEKVQHFEQHIRPVLMASCLECHGRQRSENHFRVDTRQNLISGGRNGRTVQPENPDESPLLRYLGYEHDQIQMPPDGKLDDHVIAAFEQWIADGAVWPENLDLPQDGVSLEEGRKHWAYRPLAKPDVPEVEGASTAIDAFILDQLNASDMRPMEPADRRTLIRRATFDLIGLPPTPDEVEAFVNDDRPDAYERLIERLLASPQYGERWGRHWMDVARYADTSGDGVDRPVPEAQLYRDYIINAFNEGMPFDKFVKEQVAGDILAKETGERYEERIIATTYIALSRRYGNGTFSDFHQVVENTIDTIGKGLLGQTLTCARCHDHKFDPIPEDDYYALYGFFASTQYPHPGSEHGRERTHFVPLEVLESAAEFEARAEREKAEIDERFARHPLAREIAQLNERIASIESELQANNDRRERLEPRIESLKNERTAKQNRLDEMIEVAKNRVDETKPGEPRLAYGVVDKEPGDIRDERVHVAGNPRQRGALAPRGFLSVITPERPEIPEGQSGRLQLAEWLVDADENPLTPRVMANRIWHWHFGKGIVRTPDNFGLQGQAPTHPELLEYLATQFVESGWSFKAMHREIMLSDAYQRSSLADSANLAVDPDNHKLWRFERRRLEAEAIRDAVLAVSGRLDLGTPPEHRFGSISDHERFTQHNPFLANFSRFDHRHRSVYLMTQRLQRHPILGLFDGPNRNEATGSRTVSTVPLQSLFMMNSSFIRENAEALTERLLNEHSTDEDRLKAMFEAAFTRPIKPDELEDSLDFLQSTQEALEGNERQRHRQAWVSLARVVLSSSEFVYLD